MNDQRQQRSLRCAVLLMSTLTGLMGAMLRPASAEIIHQYCFTEDGTDMVGGADATLVNGATVSAGQLVLDGVDDHATLPIGASLSALDTVTFEGWATITERRSWSRLFDFGNDTNKYSFLTVNAGFSGRPQYAATVSGFATENQLSSPTEQIPLNTETHFAVSLDGVNNVARMYLDGTLVATNFGFSLSPADVGSTSSNYLGRSQFIDPFLLGSFNEFRIYNTALSEVEVAASFAAGTTQCVPEPATLPLIMGLAAAGWWRRRRHRVPQAA